MTLNEQLNVWREQKNTLLKVIMIRWHKPIHRPIEWNVSVFTSIFSATWSCHMVCNQNNNKPNSSDHQIYNMGAHALIALPFLSGDTKRNRLLLSKNTHRSFRFGGARVWFIVCLVTMKSDRWNSKRCKRHMTANRERMAFKCDFDQWFMPVDIIIDFRHCFDLHTAQTKNYRPILMWILYVYFFCAHWYIYPSNDGSEKNDSVHIKVTFNKILSQTVIILCNLFLLQNALLTPVRKRNLISCPLTMRLFSIDVSALNLSRWINTTLDWIFLK